MKKVLFGLGVVAALSFPVVSMSNNEKYLNYEDPYYYMEGDGSPEDIKKIQYAYSNDYDLISELRYLSGMKQGAWPEYNTDFGSIKVDTLKSLSLVESEGMMTSLSVLQYATNVDTIDVYGRVTDPRPLLNTKKVTNLNVKSNIDSIEFLSNLSLLENLDINFDGYSKIENSFYPVITDFSVLNKLNNLKSASFESTERPFPKISLKKSMDKYVLVNPFILSKQFKNPEVKITSESPGFTFEDDILTWDGITPKTKELQISWELNSGEGGNFYYSGDSVIPINWID